MDRAPDLYVQERVLDAVPVEAGEEGAAAPVGVGLVGAEGVRRYVPPRAAREVHVEPRVASAPHHHRRAVWEDERRGVQVALAHRCERPVPRPEQRRRLVHLDGYGAAERRRGAAYLGVARVAVHAALFGAARRRLVATDRVQQPRHAHAREHRLVRKVRLDLLLDDVLASGRGARGAHDPAVCLPGVDAAAAYHLGGKHLPPLTGWVVRDGAAPRGGVWATSHPGRAGRPSATPAAS